MSGKVHIKREVQRRYLKIVPDQELNPVMMEKSTDWAQDFFTYNHLHLIRLTAYSSNPTTSNLPKKL